MARVVKTAFAALRKKTEAQKRAVISASVQDLMEDAQRPEAQGGRMPVDTGYLRNSLVSELNGAQLAEGADSYVIVAATLEPNDTARFAWSAEYAARMEFGFVGEDSAGRSFNQQGKFFVEGAVSQWQSIVERNARKLK